LCLNSIFNNKQNLLFCLPLHPRRLLSQGQKLAAYAASVRRKLTPPKKRSHTPKDVENQKMKKKI